MKGVEGVFRFLSRAQRMIVDAEAETLGLDPKVQDVPLTPEQAKLVARTVAAVSDDLDAMRFNTAISRLMEFTNAFTGQDVRPKSAMETFALLLAPDGPHVAEELWELLGHGETLAYHPWPTFDPAAPEGRRGRSPGADQREGPRSSHCAGRCGARSDRGRGSVR